MTTYDYVLDAAKRLKQRPKAHGGIVQNKDNLYAVGSAMALATKNLIDGISNRHVGYFSALSNAALRNFRSDIQRPMESGQGLGGRRQTGNFTFGRRAGGAFVGLLIQPEGKKGAVQGFGYPDVDKADAATNGVWRALEMGLSGLNHLPTYYSEEMGRFRPTGDHTLPSRYQFSSPHPSSAYLYLAGPPRKRAGRGFEGKHFIEDAWREVTKNVPEDYESIARKTFGAFR